MNQGFAERLEYALRLKELRERRDVGQKEIGKAVGELLGRKPLTQAAVSGWGKGSEPSFNVTTAIAVFVGVDPGWLAFGEASAAPAPEGWVPAQPAGTDTEPGVPEVPMTDDVTRRLAGKAGIKGILEAEKLERGGDPQQPAATEKRRRKGRG